MTQDNPFAKLGALDQKLYQETTPKPKPESSLVSGTPENQNSRNQDFQKSKILESQNSRTPENQNSIVPEIKNSRTPEDASSLKSAKREFFTKATYRLCDEALNAIEDAKKVLKRQYGLKVNLEEIVETAVLDAYKDLSDNKERSALVAKYSRNPENQNS